MKAADFQYECPLTLDEALELLANKDLDCQPLAGGQSLMPLMNLRMANPEVLLDLNRLSELNFIKKVGEQIEIGALVRYASLLKSATIRQKIPLFSQALPHIAHSAIRNRGTIGGSIALADPAAEMPALLVALNASIVTRSKNGTRVIPADDFFLGVYDTALHQEELVHTINIPAATASQSFGFYESVRRHGDYAMAGVAISAQSIEPYTQLRIVFFGIGTHPQRAVNAERILNGKSCADVVALKQAQDALSGLEYYGDMNASSVTKSRLVHVVLQRALQNLSLEQV